MATTTISITVTTPAGVTVAQVVQTLAAAWNYQPQVDDGTGTGALVPNPQTPAQFVQARIARFVRDSYVSAKSAQDAEAARRASADAAGAVTVT